MDLYQKEAYSYHLPQQLIAQHPCVPRDHARLMIVDRCDQSIREVPFYEIENILDANDRLVFNNTQVIPARLYGKKESGAKVEILLIRSCGDDFWEAMVKPGRKLRPGATIHFADNFTATVESDLPSGLRRLQFFYTGNFVDLLEKWGHMPLPHYIDRSDNEADKTAYQTVFASVPGAVAAPTAGLHFTEDLVAKLNAKGVKQHHLTLHVGLGTFQPVKTDDIRKHPMHTELCVIPPETASILNTSIEGKTVCVGTTTCRTLESAAGADGKIVSGSYETAIFIYPGYTFRTVSTLLTNFHLPQSTLLMLVCAFGGYDLMMKAYREAVEKKFRFFSYGDAMLII